MNVSYGSIIVIDPYLDGTIFELLKTVADAINSFRLLTYKISPDFQLEANKFVSQYNVSLEVRQSKDFHDRFVILDNHECWHIGASIKDAGAKAFMLSRVEDERNRNALVTQLLDALQNASPVTI